MHHTISDSSIQPTQSTSKSAPKFLMESQDEKRVPTPMHKFIEPASCTTRKTPTNGAPSMAINGASVVRH